MPTLTGANRPEVPVPPLLRNNFGVSLAVNKGFLQQNNIVFIHTEPFENVCSFNAFSQAPHVEEDNF